jgi:hypothetical protein
LLLAIDGNNTGIPGKHVWQAELRIYEVVGFGEFGKDFMRDLETL